LEIYRNSSTIWADVETLLATALTSGGDFEDTALGKLMASGDVATMNYLDSEEWWNDFHKSLTAYAITTGQFTPNESDPPVFTGDIESMDKWADIDWATVDWGSEEWSTLDWTTLPEKYYEVAMNSYTAYAYANIDWSSVYSGMTDAFWSSVSSSIDWDAVVSELADYYGVPQYATGGLADFTGPAWLDGTKSHPELVLNQRDTANFIQLKDILAEVMERSSGTSGKAKSAGDNYFEIEINVDSIESDYDVEQMADKIRSMIYEDATYRNVNAINHAR
jgi:hypothetical protein